jgi:hypothetical protein
MQTGMQRQSRQKERKKLVRAAVAGAGAAGLFVVGWPVLGTAALVGAGVLCYDWFMFRAKNGMRF